MTFYEELGVPRDAPLETIREAYRNVARLLHPDAHTNPALKESADVQMKRINHLYDVLSDPERRRRYDQELAAPPDHPGTIIIHAPPPEEPFQNRHSGTLVWFVATAIGATFIIWLASRESSAPVVYPQSGPGAGAAASMLLRTMTATQPKRDDEIARLRAQLAAANADRERLMKQIAAMQGGHKFQPPPPEHRQQVRMTATVSLPPAPMITGAALPDIALPAVSARLAPPPGPPPSPPSRTEPLPSVAKPVVTPATNQTPRSRWTGSWAYKQPRTDNPGKALLPPEFIETVISEQNGRIHGQYHARFKVAGHQISPDVDFRFEGKVSGPSGRFSWTGNGGAKGEVQIRLISETTLEVVWSATSLGRSMGLASGTAVLNRRN